jgi:hypothetical protein
MLELAEVRRAEVEGRDLLREAADSLSPGGSLVLRGRVLPEPLATALFVDSLDLLRDPDHSRANPVSVWVARVTAAGFEVDGHELMTERLDFGEWCAGGSCSEETVEALVAHMRRMPRAAVEWLCPEWVGGDDSDTPVAEQERGLVAFHVRSVVLRAHKPI